MSLPRRRRRSASAGEEFRFDPSPLYSCAVDPDGRVHDWMAFDPAYGPDSEKQIEWHKKRGTPGAEGWKVGVPCKVR